MHRTQPRPLRDCGTGTCRAADLLVAIDVHDAGTRKRSDLRTFGKVTVGQIRGHRPFHYRQPADVGAKGHHMTKTFGCATHGHWIWLRVRCELVQIEQMMASQHLIGIALDITRAEEPRRKDRRSRSAPALTRSRPFPKPLVLWDAGQPPSECRATPSSSGCIGLSPIPPSPRHAVRNRQSKSARHAADPRTRHGRKQASSQERPHLRGQLDDGQWLHISERRTKDGGYVSVGTNITDPRARADGWTT